MSFGEYMYISVDVKWVRGHVYGVTLVVLSVFQSGCTNLHSTSSEQILW